VFRDLPEKPIPRPLNARTFGVALALHAALFLFFWLAGLVFFRAPDVVIPIDMTIVPPWAEKSDEPEVDPNPPPPPKPVVKQPEPKPVEEPPPKLEETKQDAVVKEVEKPKPKKPEIKKGDFKKNKKIIKTPPKKEEPPDFRKDKKLIKPPPSVTKYGSATAREKPLSEAEIQKALNAGARFGSTNQLAANEEQRCYSLIQRRFYECWTGFTWNDGLRPVHLYVRFGAGGRITAYRIVQSSGDPAVDQSVLAAAKRAGYVSGLSADFLQKYPEITIEMKPTRGE